MTDGQSEVQRSIDEEKHKIADATTKMVADGEGFILGVRPCSPCWRWILYHEKTSQRLAEGVMVNTEGGAVREVEQIYAAGIFSDRVKVETFTHRPSEEIIVSEQELTLKRKVANLRDLLTQSQAQIALALPQHMTPERMLRVVMTTVQKTPALLECSPLSLIGAVVEASQLGLEPDNKRQAHLIPFHNKKTGQKEVQLIPDYRGLMDLAYRSGKVSTIAATIVHELDEYQYSEGLLPVLEHVPSRDAERGEVVAAYAVASLTDGQRTSCWMWRAEIDKVRNGSKAGKSGPWVTHFNEMAKKTAIRRLCKYLPVSIVQRAVTLLDQAETGQSQNLVGLSAAGPSMPLLPAPADAEQPEPETETAEAETIDAEMLAQYQGLFNKKTSKGSCDKLFGEAEELHAGGGINAAELGELEVMRDKRWAAIKADRGAGSNKTPAGAPE